MERILRNRLLLLLAIGLLPLLVYVHSLWNDFVYWDDPLLILENSWVHGLTWVNIHHAFTSYDPELYIPLTLLSYQVTYAIAGLSPFLYHLGNLLLHTISVLLLFSIVLQLTKRTPVAVAAAILFAVHPLNTEAVAWAAARKDVLSNAFLFLTLATFLRYRSTDGKKWYAVSVVSFLLGLLSKVSIITAPFALMAMDWYQGRVSFGRALQDALLFFGLSIIFGIISFFGKATHSAFFYEKFLIGMRAITFFLTKLLLPWGLTAFYPYTHAIGILSPDLLASLIVVIAITVLCLWLCRWTKAPLFAWAMFLLFLIPSFANMAKGKNEALDVYITSDRYAYSGLLGPFLLIGLGFDWLLSHFRQTAWAVLAGVTVLLSGLSYRQSLFWKNSEMFFSHAIAVSPNSYIAHLNLGSIEVKRHDIDAGFEEYKTALKIRPDAMTYTNVGLILEYQDKIPEAIAAYQEALKSSDIYTDAWVRLGALYSQNERFADAVDALQKAVDSDPTNMEAQQMLNDVKAGKAVK